MNELPWTSYSRYLRERFGSEVHRIAVDAGFSCPNRQGGRGAGGCSYCGADASRTPALGREGAAGALRGQILDSLEHMRGRHPGAAYILYFQAFTCTNAPAADLARLYGEGLACGEFVGLQVATRPDCMDEEKARMLASFRSRGLEVWVELGLQTANDRTLRRVARGHTAADFARACGQLKDAGLKTAVHLIFGLPGETEEDAAATARFVAGCDPDGVKIHNLHVPRASRLFSEYLAGEITAPGPERHLQCTLRALELLPSRTLVMRLTTDTPGAELAAPRGFWQKSLFIDRLASEMRARGTWQGRLHAAA